jgi:Reverse transcriptase (RNA-dependent DNA polymerase)
MLRLKETSLEWALKHALNLGDTDVFPIPFEYRALESDWSDTKKYLQDIDVLKWQVRPLRTLLAPKGKFGFRIVTQLDPLDFLLYAAAIREIGSDLEKRRVPVSEQVVFSYRFKPSMDGHLFDSSVGYGGFQERTRAILRSPKNSAFVAVTDIADFYLRIYHHRLKGALEAATLHSSHVGAIMSLLSGWNTTESYGIPVGNAPSRLLAEITISDVDEALLGSNIKFVRYNDDYRIFASTYSEAYRYLAFLADFLYRNHGLTLQPQKTIVLSADEFKNRFLPSSPEDRELASLEEKFDELIEKLNLEDRYTPIDYDDLDEDEKELIDSLNLVELFQEQLSDDNDIDVPLARFILRRLTQLGDGTILEDLLDNLDVLHPLFPEMIAYIRADKSLSNKDRAKIGKRILDLAERSIVSELDYHRMWALHLFAESTDWNNADRFPSLLAAARDQLSRRKLILAMGRARQRYWFQGQWRKLFEEAPWTRRAMLAGFSCLSPDPRKHQFKAIESRLDPLEKAVMRWVKKQPF